MPIHSEYNLGTFRDEPCCVNGDYSYPYRGSPRLILIHSQCLHGTVAFTRPAAAATAATVAAAAAAHSAVDPVMHSS